MKFAILHLSDIHLSTKENPVFFRTEAIANSLKAFAPDVEAVLIAITGDVVSTGAVQEFELANTFLLMLKRAIQTGMPDVNLHEAIVPGNHDFDRTKDNNVRAACIKGMSESELMADDILEQVLLPQQAFFEFLNSRSNPKIEGSSQIIWKKEWDISDKKVRLNCINTSVLLQNELSNRIPVRHIQNYADSTPECQLSITLLHHTYSWFHPDTARELRNKVESFSDYVLCGHEHLVGGSMSTNFDDHETVYIEGGALQPHADYGDNAFNILKFDMDSPVDVEVISLHWQSAAFVKKAQKTIAAYNNHISVQGHFKINGKFETYLNELGSLIKHPAKDMLLLSDIFVAPNFEKVSATDDAKKRPIKGAELFDCIIKEKNFRYLILGDDGSGKTSLAKKLFRMFYAAHRIPVLVKGKDISHNQIDKINEIIRNSIADCYTADSVDEIFVNPDKVFIIDDFDSSSLVAKARSVFIENLLKISSNIIIFADSFFDLHKNIINSEPSGRIWISFDCYKILDFNRRLQYEIVKRWVTLGIDCQTCSDTDLLRLIDEKVIQLKAIFKRGIIPYTPLYIISILQTLESYNYSSSMLEQSSYGSCYQALVTIALSEVVAAKDIELFLSFLKDFAYHLYSEEKSELNEFELDRFVTTFVNEYQLSISSEKLLGCLCSANIIERDGSAFRYKYKYVFYFFVAKYLADNIHEESVVMKIRNIFSNLHVQRKANIATFLTYHTKNPLIIELLIQQAQEIFPTLNEVRLDSDVDFIGELFQEVPKSVAIKAINHEDSRRQAAELDDRKEELESQELQDIHEREDESDGLDELSQLVYGAKLVEIIGQVLRSYYGSLKRDDKERLVVECCNVALRSLGFMFSNISSDKDKEELINYISIAIKKAFEKQGDGNPELKKISQAEIETLAKKFIFNLCVFLASSFMHKISSCLGAKELKKTFLEIFDNSSRWGDKGNVPPAYKLIDLAIKLNIYDDIPKSEITNLASSNSFVFHIARRFVINRLYMFPIKSTERHWLSEKLKIDMKELLSIDAKLVVNN